MDISLLQRRNIAKLWTSIALVLTAVVTTAAIYLQRTGSVHAESLLTLSTLSVGVLIFVFGVNAWTKFVRGEEERPKRATVIFHAAGLLLGYYLATLIANIGLFSLPPSTNWVENIGRIVFFLIQSTTPGIVLLFALITFSILILRGIYQKLVFNVFTTFVSAMLLFLLGYALSQVQAAGLTDNILSVLSGSNTVHSYPLIQYLGVYLFGLFWGKKLAESNTRLIKQAGFLTAFFFVLFGALFTINERYSIPITEPFRIFAPSLGFLILILACSFFLYILVRLTVSVLNPHLLSRLTSVFTRFDHDLIVFPVVTGLIFSRIDVGLPMYLILVAVGSIFLAWIRYLIIHQARQQLVSGLGFNWRLNDKLILGVLWMVFLLTAGMFVAQNYSSLIGVRTVSEFSKLQLTDQGELLWWNHNFNFFRTIEIANSDDTTEIPRNTWYEFQMDHSALVSDSKSRKDGGDVRIVFYNEPEGKFAEVPFIFDNINGNSTLKFKLQETIPAGAETNKYFIYYGNPTSKTFPKSPEVPVEVKTNGIQLIAEQRHLLQIKSARQWHLTTDPKVNFVIELDPEIGEPSQVSYSIANTELGGVLQRVDGKYSAEIDIASLKAGYYEIQATAIVVDGQIRVHRSNIANIAYSEPLYVAWTLDWEGWDVPDTWLDGMDQLSTKYSVPMTHFFNPRIYVTKAMSQQRAQVQTNWVKDRMSKNGDEIQLHLHMWTDMVEAAGVEPRKKPAASWVLTGDGYNVPAYAYTVEELEKILLWSKAQFEEHGLPEPEIFRAGLWMSGENVLEALENTDFLGDSSGRTAFNVGEPPVPWHLEETSQPYKPNLYDMNRALEPTFDLWEFPNNGADSYWFSDVQMIDRFKANYPNLGKPLSSMRSVNLLSHPQFYLVDQPKLDNLFDYVSDFNFQSDKGPVIFTTLKKTLPNLETE